MALPCDYASMFPRYDRYIVYTAVSMFMFLFFPPFLFVDISSPPPPPLPPICFTGILDQVILEVHAFC